MPGLGSQAQAGPGQRRTLRRQVVATEPRRYPDAAGVIGAFDDEESNPNAEDCQAVFQRELARA
jgi:hypothetical protein